MTTFRAGFGILHSVVFTLAALSAVMLCALPVRAATYYVDAGRGRDSNDGLSPAAAWRTLDRVNDASLKPGDTVLFKRGETWRGRLNVKSGKEGARVTYGAYGKGPKPLLLGSVNKSAASDWASEGGNIWVTPIEEKMDVGNIIFNHEQSVGVKKWDEEELHTQGDFWYDEQNAVLKLYSVGNPGARYRDIECALTRRHAAIIVVDNAGYVVIEDLALKYGGSHGISIVNSHHIIIRGCELSWIGGGDQYGGDATVRYGNAIEFWAANHDCLVEGNRIWEIYDSGVTNQNTEAGAEQYNITYRNNVIWNCTYSFEFFDRPESASVRNIVFDHNTCAFAGYEWGYTQRPNKNACHVRLGSSTASVKDFRITNNIFYISRNQCLFKDNWYNQERWDNVTLDHNVYYQRFGNVVKLHGAPGWNWHEYSVDAFSKYQTEQGKDASSLAADPRFVDANKHDFHLAKGSPCIDAGAAGSAPRDDADGRPRPQGAGYDIGAYEYVGARTAK